jgi:hypothetical protein
MTRNLNDGSKMRRRWDCGVCKVEGLREAKRRVGL